MGRVRWWGVDVQMRSPSDWPGLAPSRADRGTHLRPRNRASRNLSGALDDGNIERHNRRARSNKPPHPR
jgi:hypothetical protein